MIAPKMIRLKYVSKPPWVNQVDKKLAVFRATLLVPGGKIESLVVPSLIVRGSKEQRAWGKRLDRTRITVVTRQTYTAKTLSIALFKTLLKRFVFLRDRSFYKIYFSVHIDEKLTKLHLHVCRLCLTSGPGRLYVTF